jgi:PBP1b-binding outer membrane lipoprotein LpoB
MNSQAKAVIVVAAIAGLIAGCASPAPKQSRHCKLAGQSDKVSSGSKNGCSPNGCAAMSR